MRMPFTREQFFELFGQYNESVWPAQLAILALAVASLALVLVAVVDPRAGRAVRAATRAPGWALALLWGWMAVAYHFVFFTRINPAAWIFGAAFLLAAGLFAVETYRGRLRFEQPRGGAGALGLGLVFYALVGYPIVGVLSGHAYPHEPTFGLPCPTTIFTLGLLLLARRPAPASVFVVPFAWSLVGSTAAFQLGVAQDYGLLAAAALAGAALALRRRRSARPPRPRPRPGTGFGGVSS